MKITQQNTPTNDATADRNKMHMNCPKRFHLSRVKRTELHTVNWFCVRLIELWMVYAILMHDNAKSAIVSVFVCPSNIIVLSFSCFYSVLRHNSSINVYTSTIRSVPMQICSIIAAVNDATALTACWWSATNGRKFIRKQHSYQLTYVSARSPDSSHLLKDWARTIFLSCGFVLFVQYFHRKNSIILFNFLHSPRLAGCLAQLWLARMHKFNIFFTYYGN